MVWEGGHLHEFQFRDDAYGIPDPDWAQYIHSENRSNCVMPWQAATSSLTPVISATIDAIQCGCWRNFCRFRKPTGYTAWQGRMPARPKMWVVLAAMPTILKPSPTRNMKSMRTWSVGVDPVSIRITSISRRLPTTHWPN